MTGFSTSHWHGNVMCFEEECDPRTLLEKSPPSNWVYEPGSMKGVSEARELKAEYQKDEHRSQIETANALREEGFSNSTIASKMGISESSVRTLLLQVALD